jgi:hypothetical protein
MSEQEQLNRDIASLERAIVERTSQLRVAEAKWDDYRAGTLRGAISNDRVMLHNLKLRRSSLAPAEEKRSSAVFYGSNG